MIEQYDTIVTRKGLFGNISKFKGKILSDEVVPYEDWMGPEYMERHITVKLENGKTVKAIDGDTFFYKYNFEMIK